MNMPILLMTRPLSASDTFVGRLSDEAVRGVRIISAPLIAIAPTNHAPVLDGYNGVIFSSSNGVSHAPAGKGRSAYCVGARTAQDATGMGWQVKTIAQDANDLVAALIGRDNPGTLLHLAGEHRRGDIARRLSAAGIPTDEHVLYTQSSVPLNSEAKTALAGEATVIVPLFSARTAAQFDAQVAVAPNAHILAISGAVADVLINQWADQLQIAPAPTAEEMRRSVENLLLHYRFP